MSGIRPCFLYLYSICKFILLIGYRSCDKTKFFKYLKKCKQDKPYLKDFYFDADFMYLFRMSDINARIIKQILKYDKIDFPSFTIAECQILRDLTLRHMASMLFQAQNAVFGVF